MVSFPYIFSFFSIKFYLRKLKSKNEVSRTKALEALGNFRKNKEEIMDLLIKALEDEEERVRYYAIESLGKIGDLKL